MAEHDPHRRTFLKSSAAGLAALPAWLRARVAQAATPGVLDRLVAMTYDERVANPCIGVERADLVLAGCAILEAIRRAFPCERLRVADRGLREGMLVKLMREDGAWAGAPERPR